VAVQAGGGHRRGLPIDVVRGEAYQCVDIVPARRRPQHAHHLDVVDLGHRPPRYAALPTGQVPTTLGGIAMKVQATVLLAFQAKSLAEAGAVLDDVLARARERDDVDVGSVELLSPPGDRAVTLPPVSAPLGYQPNIPPPASAGNGS
jgi:hypothetical protein